MKDGYEELKELIKERITTCQEDYKNADATFKIKTQGKMMAYTYVLNLIPGLAHVNRWIPVTERMPQEYATAMDASIRISDRVLVTVANIERESATRLVTALTINGKWCGADIDHRFEYVSAWQPLPEGYKGDDDDNK